MRPFPLSIQLYSVREAAKADFIGVLKQIAAMGYQGVEFAGFHNHQPSELRKVLDDLGLQVSSNHGALPTPENLSQILDEAGTLGYKWHISGRGRDRFSTLEETLESAKVFAGAVDLLKDSPVKYAIHNHDFEFDKRFDGKTPHQIVMEQVPGLYAQIDTYWVQTGGQDDPARVIANYGSRVPLVHIKDGPCRRGEPMTAVGEGVMQWEPIVAACDKANVEWLIVELDQCATDMMEAVEKSRNYLVEQGYAQA